MKLRSFIEIALPKLSHKYDISESRAIVRELVIRTVDINPRDWIYKMDDELRDEFLVELHKGIEKLEQGIPLQYVTGKAYFFGLDFNVNSSVLIPRPETEELVSWILEDFENEEQSVLDVGTGSACIAISLQVQRNKFLVSAMDISEEALQTATSNSIAHKAQIELLQADFLKYEKIMFKKWNIIVSNPPYITKEEKSSLHENVIRHEPDIALFAKGYDPFIFYRRLAEYAWTNLLHEGALYVELNAIQYLSIEKIFSNQGFQDICMRKDISGNYRMMRIRK